MLKKVLASTALLGLVSTSFAMDKFAPLDAGKAQVDVSVGYASFNKSFDKDGKSEDFDDKLNANAKIIELGAKYGVIPNLDVELAIPFMMMHSDFDGENSVDESGLAQPTIGAKYVLPEGFGGFLDLELPFAGEKIISNPHMGIEVGGMYVKETEQFNLYASLGYQLTLAAEEEYGDMKVDVNPGDVIGVEVKPQFNVSPQLGVFADVVYQMSTEVAVEGDAQTDSGSSVMSISPGVDFKISEAAAVEAMFDYVVMGKNTIGGWAAGVKGKFNF